MDNRDYDMSWWSREGATWLTLVTDGNFLLMKYIANETHIKLQYQLVCVSLCMSYICSEDMYADIKRELAFPYFIGRKHVLPIDQAFTSRQCN